jgi:hypothetical protein
VIETLHVRAPVPGYRVGTLLDYARQVWPDAPWIPGRSGSAVIRVKGALTLAFQPVTVGPNKGDAHVVVQANLTRLLHGEGKSFSLKPSEVPDGCAVMLSNIAYWLGPRTPAPWEWRVSRVDANGTFGLADRDAALFLDEVGHQLWSEPRGKTDRPGRFSYRHSPNSTEQVAIYSKTEESGRRAANGSHLVRIEVRDFKDRARKHYGDLLTNVIESGATVAKERVSSWLDRLGRQVYADPSRVIVDRLILRGVDPVEAFRLAGPTLVLAADGIDGLVSRGVPPRTAYRWASEIRAVVRDPDSFLAETGIQLTVDDVLFAADETTEVASR